MLNGVVIQWYVDPRQINIKAAFKEIMSIGVMLRVGLTL
jgi:hypothetical protein